MSTVPWRVELTLDAKPGHRFGSDPEEAIKSLDPAVFPQVITRTDTRMVVHLRISAKSEADARVHAEKIITERIPHYIWAIAAASARRDTVRE